MAQLKISNVQKWTSSKFVNEDICFDMKMMCLIPSTGPTVVKLKFKIYLEGNRNLIIPP